MATQQALCVGVCVLVLGIALRYWPARMPSSTIAMADAVARLRAPAYSVWWRIVAGVLVAVSAASLPAILLMALSAIRPVPLAAWVRALVPFFVAPALLAAAIRYALTVDVEVRPAELVLRRQRLRLEIPCEAIGRVRPWVVPLPGAGFSLFMRSGRRLYYAVQTPQIADLLTTLAEVGGVESARTALAHPTTVYARAKQRAGIWRWYHLLLKFVLFALGPAAVWFNLNQHVAFGGLFGQYYLQGLGPYIKTFAIHWGLVIVYLVLYASVWRGLAEGMALLAAWVAPAGAMTVRRWAEIACRLLYYVGVPVLIAIPFLR